MIKGDICRTVPAFLTDNPEFLVSLLYLDCDGYAPTKTCLGLLLPRMSKGAVVVFDKLALREFPGETIALMETISLRKLPLRRLPFIKASHAVIE